MPADVEGAQMLSESLSEYAVRVVTDRLLGRAFTQKFLRAELERYLRGRAGETKGEDPLTRVDLQAYIWYQKGALALFALRDLIGENALHGALRAYLDEGRFAGPPYATTLDLMKHIVAATPDSLKYAIDDYFETITLWDVKTDSVISVPQPGGQYKVTVVGTATKLRADFLVKGKPARAGIDPYNLLVDRVPGDNSRDVKP